MFIAALRTVDILLTIEVKGNPGLATADQLSHLPIKNGEERKSGPAMAAPAGPLEPPLLYSSSIGSENN